MKVTIFHTTNCPFCSTEKQWLDAQGIDYISRNIETDPDAAKAMAELTPHKAVPVTTVEDGDTMHVVYGFDRPELQRVLGL
jgi:glutaredoxin